MNSVVIELQQEAMNRSVKTSDLLRKAYVVARKLKLSEFQEWIEHELNGYKEKVPDYRIASGQIRGWNPFNGWIPLMFEDPREGEAFSKRACGQSIAELEHIIDNGSSSLHMPYPQEVQRKLCQGFGYDTEISLFVGQSALVKVIDSVRNIILNWALKLEEDGIMGEGLTFSEKEKNSASSTPQNINNFYGSVSAPQIQQGNQTAIQVASTINASSQDISEFIEKLKDELESIILPPDSREELCSEIATVDSQLKSPKPKALIIKESMKSIRSILEGATGSAAGQLLTELGRMVLG
ncbi:hypothetical protein FH712_15055 [Marinobacter nauticus]|uniref:AbiTii domain-containing protein n=1 Tax=Marinobacter nauticus TaxID=2743 RepID=UPI00112FCFC4|nr:hypothetical protein [Marinobacter nauticus]TPW22685.1 hypothetical protein FH712_15055 [Marinobacter nauticus]